MKKIATLAALILAGTLVFAQTSNTSKSTSGVFTTDIDNFMSVTNWSTVNPKTMFGMLGYNGYYGTSDFQIGGAKNFKQGYMGLYLDGNLGWNFTDTFTTTVTGDETTKTSVDSGNTSNFDLSYIFGKKNDAFKFDLYYYGYSADSKTKTDGDVTSNTQRFRIMPTLSYGTKAKFKKYNLSPYAAIGYSEYVNKTKTYDDATNTTATTNDSHGYLYTNVGTGIDLGKKGKFVQSAKVNGYSYVYFYPKKTASEKVDSTTTDTTSKGKSEIDYGLTASYSGTLDATDKLSLGFKAVASASGYNTCGAKSTTVGNTSTDLAYTKTSYLGVYSYLYGGAKYTVNKTVQLNAGAAISLPTLTHSGSKSFDANHDKAGSTSTWKGTSASCPLSLTSGAAFYFGPVTVDAYANVLGSVLSNTLNTSWSSDFWTNVNTICFPSVNFMASVKL